MSVTPRTTRPDHLGPGQCFVTQCRPFGFDESLRHLLVDDAHDAEEAAQEAADAWTHEAAMGLANYDAVGTTWWLIVEDWWGNRFEITVRCTRVVHEFNVQVHARQLPDSQQPNPEHAV